MAETHGTATSTATGELGDYLDRLDAALGLPVEERASVREEIAAHLFDEQASLTAAGDPPAAALTTAIGRLGDPAGLGRALTHARQTPRSLLAAAGAGTWAAAGAALRGWIIGLALLVAGLSIAGALTAIAFRIGAIGTWTIMDQGWFTAVAATTLWFGAWAAGRAFVSRAARGAHRRAESIRPFIAVAGALVIAWLALVWLRGPQNLGSVVVLALVPAWFAMAAWTGSDRPIARSRRARVATLGLVATLALCLPLLVVAAATPIATSLSSVGSGPYASMADLLHAEGFDMAGRYVADPPDFGGTSWSIKDGVAQVTLSQGAAAATTRWHDLRVEAWRSNFDTGALDLAYRTPIATSPLSMIASDDALSGAVRVDNVRGVSEFWLVVTGVAADGQRDLLVSLGGTNTTFTGSALDWLTAH